MARPYVDFDFSVVDDPDFREDSVREVLLVPLLSSLGFTEKEPYRIIRSRPINHPYVYIGTAKKNITIIPDYLLQRDGENAWVLDAKAPGENINSGKNVEQAYSYAIHAHSDDVDQSFRSDADQFGAKRRKALSV